MGMAVLLPQFPKGNRCQQSHSSFKIILKIFLLGYQISLHPKVPNLGLSLKAQINIHTTIIFAVYFLYHFS